MSSRVNHLSVAVFGLLWGMGCSSSVDLDVDEGKGPPGDSRTPQEDTGEPNTETGLEDTADTDVPELEPAGDYSQAGPFTAGQLWSQTTGRSGNTLYVSAWFPSEDEGVEPTWYGWSGWYHRGDSFQSVTPACDTPRSVMVHSHGNISLSWEMYAFHEFLASHGWLIVAPDHTGNTLYDQSASFEQVYLRRPQDIQDVYTWLTEQSEDPLSPLYGCVDPAAGYVVSGYSFGGYTAYVNGGALVNNAVGDPVVDASDPRVTSVVALAPWGGSGLLTTGMNQVAVPTLTLGGERDATVGVDYKGLHRQIPATPRLMGSFPNAGHYSFAPLYCFSDGDGCGSGFYPQPEFMELMGTTVLSWLEYLKGRQGAFEQIPKSSTELSWELVTP